jgi:hypothetical protein
MKTEKFDGGLTGVRWRPLVLAMMLCGVFAGTGTIAGAQTPAQYHDVGGMQPSHDCADTSKFNGVYLPDPMPSGHVYVLLLIFNSAKEAGDAGPILFHADKPIPNNPTWSCVEDPQDSGVGVPRGLVAKGGCPTDCALADRHLLEGIQSFYRKPSNKQTAPIADPDPLKNMSGKPGWAIFSAGDVDATPEHPGARVWQIRAANAVHAGAILASLHKKKLEEQPGYIGHLLIGYTPEPSSANRW